MSERTQLRYDVFVSDLSAHQPWSWSILVRF